VIFVRAVLSFLTCLALASCGGGGSPKASSSPSPSPTPADTRTIGVIALGHSGITGYRSDPAVDGDALQNSWATGTNPSVKSLYARLVAVRPEVEGHVDNQGIDGSGADVLLDEVQAALQNVPHPQLAVIMTVDNDVKCDGGDRARVPEYGRQVKAALTALVTASPGVTIVMVTGLGNPLQDVSTAIKVAGARDTLIQDGPCRMVDPSGHLDRKGVAELTALNAAFAGEAARVCRPFRQCHLDGGAAARFTSFVNYAVPGDWNHLTVRGHARLAGLEWPVVARLLGVPAS